jgi:hypothetical protein
MLCVLQICLVRTVYQARTRVFDAQRTRAGTTKPRSLCVVLIIIFTAQYGRQYAQYCCNRARNYTILVYNYLIIIIINFRLNGMEWSDELCLDFIQH